MAFSKTPQHITNQTPLDPSCDIRSVGESNGKHVHGVGF